MSSLIKMIKKMDKDKKISIINALFVFCIIFYLLVCFTRSILKPKNVFERENRYAAKYANLNIENFYNKTAQDNIENVLSDQLVFSGGLRSINNRSKAVVVKNYIDLFLDDDDLKYLDSNGILFYGKNNLVYYLSDFSAIKEPIDLKIDNYNNLMEKYKDIDFYLYYIERDKDIDFRDNTKSGIYEYLKEKIRTNNIAKFEIDNFEQYKEYFYKTDHHWNYKGSYEGYKGVLSLLNIKDEPLVGNEKCLNLYWSGSKARSSIYDGVFSDDFCAYEFSFPEMEISVNGVDANYGYQDEYLSGKYSSSISYGGFYGGDDGEVIFDTKNDDKENILIIGESYDNAILKLLAAHFDKTISVDLRNYDHYMEKEFDFDKYIQEYNIKKVLFIGNADFYKMEDFIIEGGE